MKKTMEWQQTKQEPMDQFSDELSEEQIEQAKGVFTEEQIDLLARVYAFILSDAYGRPMAN